MTKFNELIGKILFKVKNIDNREIIFICSDGTIYKLYHEQDCCEIVEIVDIEGSLKSLIGSQILQAELVTNENDTEEGSQTWAFYKLQTRNGWVTIRWLGESNGCYSEEVTFEKL